MSRKSVASTDSTDISSAAGPGLGRRAELTRGGVVAAAGLAGAGVAMAAASPASAATVDLVLNQANSAGSSATPTELDAANNTAPAFIVANTGVDPANNGSGPNLRLTPSTATANLPTYSTAGGDLTATGDGNLYFTHDFSGTIVAATVLTEATGNVYGALVAPVRMLDTRYAASRTNVLNASGNLDSKGRLISLKTIYLNLYPLVYFAEAVFANVTVTQTTAPGYLTIWAGGTRPTVSTIDYAANESLANFFSCAVGTYPVGSSTPTAENAIAIFTDITTHVIVDVTAFTVPGFEYLKAAGSGAVAAGTASASAASRAQRLARAQQAMRAAGHS